MKFLYLNLKAGHVADGKPEDSSHRHHGPELQTRQVGELQHRTSIHCLSHTASNLGHHRKLPEEKHEWQEEDTGDDIVVEGETPDIPVHRGQHTLQALHGHRSM